MSKKYTKKQFWQLYEKLPQELKNAVFAEETDDSIYEACKNNEVLDSHKQIIEYVGQVLIGVLRPDEFQETIEKELELDKNVAKKMTQEINRFIFFPVKKSLEDIYSMEIAQPAQMEIPGPIKRESVKKGREDDYREPVE